MPNLLHIAIVRVEKEFHAIGNYEQLKNNEIHEYESGKKGVHLRITGANKHRMVVDHSSIIREVDVGAAFFSTFTKPIFVKRKELGVISQLRIYISKKIVVR